MADSYDIYMILEAELANGNAVQALVLKEAFDAEPTPADYFVRPKWAKVIGKASIVTSGPPLPDVFIGE